MQSYGTYIANSTSFDNGTATTTSDITASSSSIQFSLTEEEATPSATSSEASSIPNSPVSTTSSTLASQATGDAKTGRGTFYEVGNDNCGTSSTDEDLVCAIAKSLYDSSASSDSISTYCGEYITANYDGKSVRVKVVDSCESCAETDLDFSPSAFQQLADLDIGVIEITWNWD
ncbi:hypothetical protein FOA43_003444 [Brettanomyces nanus]|uniref:RlpA-like protein double-psi beta-barrel domain-containing protein n=1 Tax=Eeniella nana TaxID=13502 RepID=A0A875S524_EENNA|nr:uncharacterized protein FOA43_003444 [Brettanomyces nanus]QPG76058.1 hypothetical protein FOA43_003444 [Brettanomyces nanus]